MAGLLQLRLETGAEDAVLRASSKRTPARTSSRERTHSANAMMPKKNRTISETASSVSWFWLTITRSKICSMYSVGESISRLATRLNRPTTTNSRRNDQRTVDNSSRRRASLFIPMPLYAAATAGAFAVGGLPFARHGGEHLVARAERLHLAVAQDEQAVDHVEDALAVRNDDERSSHAL